MQFAQMTQQQYKIDEIDFCPLCGRDYRNGEKFCSDCGARLLPRVTRSDTPDETQVAPGKSDARDISAERKDVTILFADIVGSFELIKTLDPEDAQMILSPLLEEMGQAVHDHHGMVLQFLGDGIMALFGAPISRENHAAAACVAALKIQEIVEQKEFHARGLNVQVRVGLNSGEAVVGIFGKRVIREYSVIGEAVHLAARMEQNAPPGQIFATDATFKQASGPIEFSPVGKLDVKGLSEPVQVHRVTGHTDHDAFSNTAVDVVQAHFVGRDTELNKLATHLKAAGAGQPSCVTLIGDPGIGKTTVIRQFLGQAGATDNLVLKCKASAYANIAPYHGLVLLLQTYLGVTAHDSGNAIKDRLASTIDRLALDPEQTAPPILHLFGALETGHHFAALDAGTRSLRIEQAIKALVRAETQKRPVIAVFEDLHWMDEPTRQFIRTLAGSADLTRLLILCSTRPDETKTDLTCGEEIEIGALDTESLTSLVDQVMETAQVPVHLREVLVRRSEGNPLFAEELARAAMEDPSLLALEGPEALSGSELEKKLPSNVRSILASRIDGLSEDTKHLLCTAAVVGPEGSLRLLQEVYGGPTERFFGEIEALMRKGFVYLESAQKPAAEFKFRHILMQEVAYSGLLRDVRRTIHSSIIDETESLFADRLDPHHEVLATHALRSRRWDKAVSYLQLSGESAITRGAFLQAVEFFSRAKQVLDNLGDGPDRIGLEIDLLFNLRNALQPLGDRKRIFEVLKQAEVLASEISDQHRGAWVQSYLTDHFWIVGEYENSILAGQRALQVATAAQDLRLNVITNLPLGLSHHTMGDYRDAISHFEDCVKAVDQSASSERFGLFVMPTPFAQSFIAWSLAELGSFNESQRMGSQALDLARAAKHPFSIGYAHLGLGVAYLRQGRVGQAIAEFENALSDQGFSDSPVGFSFVALHLGYAYVLDGRADQGLVLLEQTVRMAEEKGFVARHALRLAYLSEALLAIGRTEDAQEAAQKAVTRAHALGERANEAFSLFILGRINRRSGDNKKAQENMTQAIALGSHLEITPLQANCFNALSEITAELGNPDQAETHRAWASELRSQMQLTYWGT